MNEDSVNEETSKLPSVFQMDLQKREEFLSQVGSFTQEQRRIFHRICDFYDPVLDYNRFVLHAGKDILFANNQIEIMMRKIKNAHYGLLKFRLIDGELKADKIIVTNRDSREFYINLIEDEIQRNLMDDSRSFLKLPDLEEQNQRVPFDFVDTMHPESLSPSFIKLNKNEARIYTMPLKTGAPLLATSGSLGDLIELSQIRIKSYLNNTSFISIISRYMNIKISDIQRQLSGKDRSFWLNLATNIFQNKEDLQLRLKHLEDTLFQGSEIIFHYYTNCLKEEKQEREDNAAKYAALDEVCMEILQKENFLITDEDLIKILEPYAKKWEGFKEYFFESAVKMNNKIGLPLILNMDAHYIHRDHVYPFFRSELSIQSKELKLYYIQLMERMLRTGNKDRITVFYTRETFKEDVMDMIRKEAPILAEFLIKPKIVSEGIVHYFKNLKKVRDVNKIKDFMNNFFDQGIIRFKDTDFLLNLYLLEIFDEAYKFLSWWKKMVLRLSGRKDSFINQFSGLSSKEDLPPLNMMNPKKSISKRSLDSYQRIGKTRKNDKSKNDGQTRRKNQDLSQKMYSVKQREKAWLEFEDAFHRKNQ
ncbi:hypothetical protein [Oceanispirochaeta sp.]|jgi:hypothetical protein|uniref:hypothetical protein n=1 Tax=Oceanispirochaeta sp. TaxID=2035350 RepID=UPI00263493C2|nr:hypothetical protein [Oceanispirochaeta sp.]MDA3955882.1 hypothetical protein [Oceanispirochaeta sp.]